VNGDADGATVSIPEAPSQKKIDIKASAASAGNGLPTQKGSIGQSFVVDKMMEMFDGPEKYRVWQFKGMIKVRRG
jgi:hypothetical protein